MPVLSDNQGTAPVAVSIKNKAKKSPAPVVPVIHDWPFAEDLTEIEGQTVEALRKWTRAAIDPAYRAELNALDFLVMGLYEARAGGNGWKAFADEPGLSTAEIAAFEVVVGFWKRHIKENKRNAKHWAKRQANQAKEGAA